VPEHGGLSLWAVARHPSERDEPWPPQVAVMATGRVAPPGGKVRHPRSIERMFDSDECGDAKPVLSEL
jgi:hypothetical protein